MAACGVCWGVVSGWAGGMKMATVIPMRASSTASAANISWLIAGAGLLFFVSIIGCHRAFANGADGMIPRRLLLYKLWECVGAGRK